MGHARPKDRKGLNRQDEALPKAIFTIRMG